MALDTQQSDDPFFDQFQPVDNSGISGYGTGGTTPPPITTASTAPTTAPTGTAAPGSITDPNAFREAWFASPYPKTTDGLKQFVAANPQFGATITGSKGSKVIIGGQAFQAVRSAGLNGGIGPAWDPLGPEGGGGGGQNSLASLGYSFGDAMQKFTPPTAEDALNSPGLQFALQEANRMAQNGAAAKGTLLNGRFQQALSASNIGNALQGYGDVYNRAFQTFTRNQDAPFSKQLSLAQLGKPGA